jgi:dimethylglycine dehydrogenase
LWRFVPLTLDEDGDADAPFCSSIFDGDGPGAERIGIVTSGGWSFTLGKSIALAYIRPSHQAAGITAHIEIFGERRAATVGREPLYDPGNVRPRAEAF